jgi:hypothetical protein
MEVFDLQIAECSILCLHFEKGGLMEIIGTSRLEPWPPPRDTHTPAPRLAPQPPRLHVLHQQRRGTIFLS